MPNLSPNLSFNLPIVSGDFEVWGGFLNDNWTFLDTYLLPDDAACPFLPLTGGTLTGGLTITGNNQPLTLIDSNAPTDQGKWRVFSSNSGLIIEALLDDDTPTDNYTVVSRYAGTTHQC